MRIGAPWRREPPPPHAAVPLRCSRTRQAVGHGGWARWRAAKGLESCGPRKAQKRSTAATGHGRDPRAGRDLRRASMRGRLPRNFTRRFIVDKGAVLL
eukprot:scaffold13454_cov114-Isochrysis_galbana.AAC.7